MLTTDKPAPRREGGALETREGIAADRRDDVASKSHEATAFVIETAETAAGIVIRQADGFRFFAADARFTLLDGSVFKTPKAAQKAAELMQRAAARDHATARRFGGPWHDHNGRPAVA